ncbi:3-dehydroquinate synthase [uncultured Desulfobacterium sp.]|uniref:3-dehydroquinate synthase n=1 Tax=uncultured Desulfobacterium sp. TaxID=201089 RepID=A0A445MS13_9BACT|nr:3-dehydroquinate synthase [uncultured Desulfobacterium sp.]
MKEIWVKADPWNKELVTTALEAGAEAVIVPKGKTKDVKELGLITTVAEDGDLKWGQDIVYVEVKSTADEKNIIDLSRQKKVIVKTDDWTIIPLENLVAQTGNIFVEVADIEGARTSAGILEKGVDGLIITETDPIKVRQIINEIRSGEQSMELTALKILNIRPLGMGDRVCIDTCTMMGIGEGCLVGNSSQALFLVHAESIENPYVAPRPFRVNAGPVHAYVMAPGGKTRYLSELTAGDQVTRVNAKGKTMALVVGRVKIERRPLLLVEATGPNGQVSTILQNAETIRLVGTNGEAISVVKLKPGDEVLAYVEEAGRHFGHKIKETIMER